MNDETIIRMLISRSERAICEMEKKYGDRLRALSFSITRDRLDAEECVNDAFLAVWNSAKSGAPSPLYAYLSETARHISYNRVRSRKAQKRCGVTYDLSDYESTLASGVDVFDELEADALRLVISDFLRSLSSAERLLFTRRFMFSDSYDEISRALGISVKSVSVRLTRLREKLRRYLNERGYVMANGRTKSGRLEKLRRELEARGVAFTEADRAQIEKIESLYGIKFPKTLAEFYMLGVPTDADGYFPSWLDMSNENVEAINARIREPKESLWADVKDGFWLPLWGERPQCDDAFEARFCEIMRGAPALIPIYGRRCVCAVDGVDDPPVISASGGSTIVCGSNLADFLSREFSGKDGVAGASVRIPFWSGIIEYNAPRGIRQSARASYGIGKTYTLAPIDGGFVYVDDFSQGLAYVQYSDGRCGYIDRTGRLKIPAVFRDPRQKIVDQNGDEYYTYNDTRFRSGLACVADENGKYGYIDTRGERAIPFRFDYADAFCEDGEITQHALAALEGENVYIDTRGDVIFRLSDIERDEAYKDYLGFDGELISVVRGGRVGYVDVHGKTVIPFEYDVPDCIIYTYFREGLMRVKKDGFWRCIDRDNNTVIGPLHDVDFVGDFRAGVALISRGEIEHQDSSNAKTAADRDRLVHLRCKNIRKGLIDKSGNVILQLLYNVIYNLSDSGRYVAFRDGREFIIDRFGNVINELRGLCYAGSSYPGSGYIRAKTDDDRTAILDYDGNIVMPPVYADVSAERGHAIVKDDHGRFGVVDIDGNMLVPFEFDRISRFDSEGCSIARRGDTYCVLRLI